MTVSKKPENITTGQLFSIFSHCAIYIFLYGLEIRSFFAKMWNFSLTSILIDSAESLKSVKSFKNEEFQEVQN